METTDYVPFGPEWEAEIMKMNKRQIIALYRRTCQKHKAASKGYSLEQVKEILGEHEPWSLFSVLDKLVEASEILLQKKNYDGHGWEEIHHAAEKAKKIMNALFKLKHDEVFKNWPEGKSLLERSMPVGVQGQRRIRIDLNEPAELAIRNAVNEVEKIGADTRLTEAVILLDKARELVADYIDHKLSQSMKTLGSNR